MKSLRILVPILITAVLTVLAVFFAIWIGGLVPPGEWSDLIKAFIAIFIIGTTLLVIVWSAYFSYVIKTTIERLMNKD